MIARTGSATDDAAKGPLQQLQARLPHLGAVRGVPRNKGSGYLLWRWRDGNGTAAGGRVGGRPGPATRGKH
ncbi:hypothetical protein PLESTM_000023700 [Pleodorina starrii]|nr:hypothetical protein PLESTM_000023700 [Pleodorina starrii]